MSKKLQSSNVTSDFLYDMRVFFYGSFVHERLK